MGQCEDAALRIMPRDKPRIKMDHFPKVGDTVEITCDIGQDLIDDHIGEVAYRDGEYIGVRLLISGIICERYISELVPCDTGNEHART